MTFTAIVCSHANRPLRKSFLEHLNKQTRLPDEIITLVSDEDETDGCIVCPNLNDWGQQKRADGLALAKSDWLGFFNVDDEYHPQYLEKMLAETEDKDIVACNFQSHLCGPGVVSTIPIVGHITSGNFIVRRSLAQKVGYNDRTYQADGRFIEELIKNDARFMPVRELLYWHN